MLDFLTKSISKLFGTKSDRDLKEIQPIVDKILEEYPKLSGLSNDQLRAKTAEFKKRIQDHTAAEQEETESLRKRIDTELMMEVEEKEKLYERIDELEKAIIEKNQEILDEILPEAFAVVKETARRFKELKTIEVTPTQMDRDIAAKRKSVEIKDGKAYWHNTWEADGIEVT